MAAHRTLPAHHDKPTPSGKPQPTGRLARARRAAAELTPDAIERVAQRVAQLLRHEQPWPVDAPGDTRPTSTQLLTAGQLAERLGVTRTWVYDHAAELGAITLGDGPRPRLRFDSQVAAQALQTRRHRGEPTTTSDEPRPRPARRRRPPSAVPLLPIHEHRTRGIFARWRRAQGKRR
jgi:hypothetical protein